MLDRINKCLDESLSTFSTKDIIPSEYKNMKYPKFIPFMKFNCEQKQVGDFGSVFKMRTTAMGGLMNLLTISFMPNSGKDVPFLLIDIMSMKDKRTVFVEYYDCTNKKLDFKELNDLKAKYQDVPNYEEKDKWYVKERMSCSLIKGDNKANEDRIVNMVNDSISAYFNLVNRANIDVNNNEGLKEFRQRMINEGNPSSDTLNKVLGKEKAIDFFKTCVMPIK